ncbi:DNA-binding IclR family transcriptional regulator [Halorubrum trapanicum]|uniref:DNA-binding IclR family transcriptional regulator n=1 Tax=Halorubrum trapanicum TaxID=29284 RepID=A0A8J7UN75_9EURY|nr:IclR family transcriptional regulator [Halorubrum trapanicum]MBP1902839.1 DNA-binding IclR family transcriptional regulator [Halorubrum trapanicum]
MGTTPLKTVLRAFDVIRILNEEGEAQPSQVAAELGTSRATAHQYLVSLAEVGYVTQENGRYDVSYRFLETGNQKKYRSWLFHATVPALAALHEETGEPAHLGVEEGGEWVLLHRENERRETGLSLYSGSRLPLHTNAAGKVVLTEITTDRRDEILDEKRLYASTEQSITDRDELRRELEEISTQGYAVDWNEEANGTGFVACPITIDGYVGSISIVESATRLRRMEYRKYLVDELQAAADDIQDQYRRMSEHGPPQQGNPFTRK